MSTNDLHIQFTLQCNAKPGTRITYPILSIVWWGDGLWGHFKIGSQRRLHQGQSTPKSVELGKLMIMVVTQTIVLTLYLVKQLCTNDGVSRSPASVY